MTLIRSCCRTCSSVITGHGAYSVHSIGSRMEEHLEKHHPKEYAQLKSEEAAMERALQPIIEKHNQEEKALRACFRNLHSYYSDYKEEKQE